MRRREFIALLGGAAAFWSQAASAQNSGVVRRIGVLLSLAESDPEGKAQFSGFTQGLAELGWIDGRNLRMEVRWGRGDIDRIRTFAKELERNRLAAYAVGRSIPSGAALTTSSAAILVAVLDGFGHRAWLHQLCLDEMYR